MESSEVVRGEEDGEIVEDQVESCCGFPKDVYPGWIRRVLEEDLGFKGPSKVQEMVA